MSAFVLMHSPSVGPLTWGPVAARIEGAVVPSLTGVADAGPPFWPGVARIVAAAVDALPPDEPVVLVAHSNAGILVPSVVDAARRTPDVCLFVDAALPERSGRTPIASPDHLAFLRPKASRADGRLPQWTRWFDDADVAPMFPDARTRREVCAEQPRLPLSYYEEHVPVPVGWDDGVRCGYLLFGPPYQPIAEDARGRGWVVRHVPGRHLHQLVDPDSVATEIMAMARPPHSR